MKYAVLEALRRRDEPVSLPALAEELSLSEKEVRDAVEALRRERYRIEAQPDAGLRLAGWQDRLIPYEIRRGLATRVIGSDVRVLERTPSTNDAAWSEALAGAPEGTAIFAEEQTAGRGRMGRSWHSPRGANLLLSIILRPTLEANQSNLLTVASSVAVAQALRENLHLQARIRWPNDITIKGRKVAGILVEGRTLATGAVFVLGIGLNANMAPGQIPPDLRDIATSLCIELGQPVSRVEVARWLLQSLDRWHRDLSFGDYGRIARCWRRLSSTMGERVTLIESGREFRGRVLDLSLEEGLIVRLDEGVTRIFHPSTVTMRQPHEEMTKPE